MTSVSSQALALIEARALEVKKRCTASMMLSACMLS